MEKMAWAKGRQSCNAVIAVDKETLELAKEMAKDLKLTIKDTVSLALVAYSINKTPQIFNE